MKKMKQEKHRDTFLAYFELAFHISDCLLIINIPVFMSISWGRTQAQKLGGAVSFFEQVAPSATSSQMGKKNNKSSPKHT